MKGFQRVLTVFLLAAVLLGSMPHRMQAEAAADDPLVQYEGVHPRIFMDENGLKTAREMAAGEYADVFASLKAYADSLIAQGPPDYGENLTDSLEDNWMRSVASDIMKLCYVYRITGEEIYKTATLDFIDTVLAYPSWGRGSTFENKDLACAHMLVALSACYDWLYDELSEQRRTQLETVLVERGIALQNDPWWKGTYLSNHLWICSTAVLVTASAIYDVYDEVASDSKALLDGYDSIDAWFNFANTRMQRALSMFPDDGSLHEGPQYYVYGMGFLQYYMDVAGKFCGFDPEGYPFFRNTAGFMIDSLIPETAEDGAVRAFNFGDSAATIDIPVFQLAFFANRYNDAGTYEMVAYFREKMEPEQKHRLWQLLLFNLASAPESAGETVFADRVYRDTGYAFSRVDTNPANAGASLGFKCGPPGGSKAVASAYNYGLSHVHSDCNSFILFDGDAPLFADDGYTTVSTTDGHNTLTVAGKGQYGEVTADGTGTGWTGGVNIAPEILASQSGEEYFYVAGEAAQAYPEELGLESFQRHLLFLKPDLLILIDDVTMKETAEDLTLHFHPVMTEIVKKTEDTLVFADDQRRMAIQSVSGSPLTVTEKEAVTSRGKFKVTTGTTAKQWTQITAISWGMPNAALPGITAENQNGVITLNVDAQGDGSADKTVAVDTQKCRVTEYQAAESPLRLSYHRESRSISARGSSPDGSRVTIQANGPDGGLAYLDQQTAQDGYAFQFATGDALGRYDVFVYDEALKTVLRGSVLAQSGTGSVAVTGLDLTHDGTYMRGTLNGINQSGEDAKTVLFLAMYGENGLEQLSLCNLDAKAGERVTAEVSLQISEMAGKQFRLFLWNQELMPLMEAVQF